MNKKKQNTYLSELFLKELNGDFSRKAVLKALDKCNDEILQRMATYHSARELIDYFFYKEKQRRKVSNQVKQELVDFWDVYGEFDDMLKLSIKKNYLILQMI